MEPHWGVPFPRIVLPQQPPDCTFPLPSCPGPSCPFLLLRLSYQGLQPVLPLQMVAAPRGHTEGSRAVCPWGTTAPVCRGVGPRRAGTSLSCSLWFLGLEEFLAQQEGVP